MDLKQESSYCKITHKKDPHIYKNRLLVNGHEGQMRA